MVVLAVGEHSDWGRTMSLVMGEAEDTPLQEKLGWLATAIGKVGLVVAIVCFVVLMIRCASAVSRGLPTSIIVARFIVLMIRCPALTRRSC
jgi:Ca2+-transporting ATPase